MQEGLEEQKQQRQVERKLSISAGFNQRTRKRGSPSNGKSMILIIPAVTSSRSFDCRKSNSEGPWSEIGSIVDLIIASKREQITILYSNNYPAEAKMRVQDHRASTAQRSTAKLNLIYVMFLLLVLKCSIHFLQILLC